MTPLKAADGLIYAVGQGTVIAGGARAEGQAAEVVEGVPTSGAIPSGARVEREVPFVFNDLHSIRLALRNPDFTTAERIETAINTAYGARVSQMLDSGTVLLDVRATREPTPAHAIGRIENLTVEPQIMARVVVDQRSGTIVMGQDVRISRVAVSQGGLVLRVEERPEVVQPNPFAQGETVVVPRTVAEIGEEPGAGFIELVGETSLQNVIDGLNALGVAPQDMIDILQTINAAGALHAEFIVR
jgi:flagellar P-ring protein FlgI